MRILVTGGAGFIGSHIVDHFQGTAEVRLLDNLRGAGFAPEGSLEAGLRMTIESWAGENAISVK